MSTRTTTTEPTLTTACTHAAHEACNHCDPLPADDTSTDPDVEAWFRATDHCVALAREEMLSLGYG